MKSNSSFLLALALALAVSAAASAGDGPVALQSADVSCITTAGRYVDCGNGTVTDNESGLTWTKNAACWGTGGFFTWDRASIEVLNLADGYCGLTDGSSPGEWRLPTRAEWERMVAAAVQLGNCDPVITNDAGTDCWTAGPSSFTNIVGFEFGVYWSATTDAATPGNAYQLLMINGAFSSAAKTTVAYVWPVRGGQ
jgi:uncharacterized protein (TIGR02145 family)